MAEVTKPIALDESLNTTESTPRNIADVLAEGLDNIAESVVPRAATQIPIESGSATNTKDYIDTGLSGKQDSLTISSNAVTWNTTNVTGGSELKYWFKYGRIVIGHLEFTPKSGKIANGNVICSGLPKPNSGYNCFGDNKQQFIIDNNGNLTWYFPTDTATLNRWDLNIVYFSAT